MARRDGPRRAEKKTVKVDVSYGNDGGPTIGMAYACLEGCHVAWKVLL